MNKRFVEGGAGTFFLFSKLALVCAGRDDLTVIYLLRIINRVDHSDVRTVEC
jgi:hypothetical protein